MTILAIIAIWAIGGFSFAAYAVASAVRGGIPDHVSFGDMTLMAIALIVFWPSIFIPENGINWIKGRIEQHKCSG